MSKLYGSLLRLVRDERGQDMVEYALLAGFIAVAAGALLPPPSPTPSASSSVRWVASLRTLPSSNRPIRRILSNSTQRLVVCGSLWANPSPAPGTPHG